MNAAQNTLLLAPAPTQELLVVGIVFSISALILFALALEAGTYPRLARAIQGLPGSIRRWWRHWLNERIHKWRIWQHVSGNGAH